MHCYGWYWHVDNVGMLLIDCWVCISYAIPYRLVRMLLYLFNRRSSSGLSLFFKTSRLIFWGSYHRVVDILISF